MIFTEQLLIGWVHSLLWPFLRISAMFMSAPIFGARSVPVRIRVSLALLLSIVIAPLIQSADGIELVSGQGFIVATHQILIGLAMGFLMQLMFTAIVLMGQSMAMSMGLGFASAIDPQNGVTVPVVSQMFMILATLLFLSMDGHLVMLAGLVASFELYPVAQSAILEASFFNLVNWASYIFLMALVMALPLMVTVLLVNLVFGIMTRAAPQLNIFAVGFPMTILIGFMMMFLTMGVFEMRATSLFESGAEMLADLFGGANGR